MKQQVTSQQFVELLNDNPKIARKWVKWYEKKYPVLFANDAIIYDEHTKKHKTEPVRFESATNCIRMLTEYLPDIGQMIEFLDEYRKSYMGHKTSIEIIDRGGKEQEWRLNEKIGNDLCDLLWEAVKEVLHENNKNS